MPCKNFFSLVIQFSSIIDQGWVEFSSGQGVFSVGKSLSRLVVGLNDRVLPALMVLGGVMFLVMVVS